MDYTFLLEKKIEPSKTPRRKTSPNKETEVSFTTGKMASTLSGHIKISKVILGTWAFGSDRWWGHQERVISEKVLEKALELGITTWDTAPVYGRGFSETILGDFLERKQARSQVTLLTKLGLSWDGRKVFHDLSAKQMRKELKASLKRLKTDVIDLYQVHWPDSATPVPAVAEVMHQFLKKGYIRSVGVSNFSLDQIKEFIEVCPLHSVQSPYNLFRREIEADIIPFCLKNKIEILGYSALHCGILTGKFWFSELPVPKDFNRKEHPDLVGPLAPLNQQTLASLLKIAQSLNKTLPQLVLNWTMHQKGITAVLAGSRKPEQILENAGAAGWKLEPELAVQIRKILEERDAKIKGPLV